MNIYVSNLDTNLTDTDLATMFAPYGQVQSANIVLDGFTDQSRGFGYVDMPNEQEAQSAIAALNQSELNGRMVSVAEAEAKVIQKGSYKVGNPAVQGYQFKKN